MFNPFKKQAETPKGAGKSASKSETKKRPEKLSSLEVGSSPSLPASYKRRITGVILSPHTTEKTSSLVSRGWYAFSVASLSSKPLIKRAVEDRYGVKVLRVRIINQHSRGIRLGRIQGRVPGFKKAMVKVKAGQSIEFT